MVRCLMECHNLKLFLCALLTRSSYRAFWHARTRTLVPFSFLCIEFILGGLQHFGKITGISLSVYIDPFRFFFFYNV